MRKALLTKESDYSVTKRTGDLSQNRPHIEDEVIDQEDAVEDGRDK